jgi:hypothetical protein
MIHISGQHLIRRLNTSRDEVVDSFKHLRMNPNECRVQQGQVFEQVYFFLKGVVTRFLFSTRNIDGRNPLPVFEIFVARQKKGEGGR